VINESVGSNQDKKMFQIEERLKLNSYNISPDEIEWSDERIGHGGSGIVKKALWLQSTEVAVKLLHGLPEFIDDKEMTNFYKEIELLR
jgi:hypothetical protein